MAIAYRAGTTAGNSGGTDLSINKPTGTADNDILVVVGYREAGAWTPPVGWAQWGSDQRDYNTSMYLSVWWKRASSEGASWTWALDTTTFRILVCAAFSGGYTTGDPIDVGPTGNGTNTNGSPVGLSITTLTANTMAVIAVGNWDGSDVTAGSAGYGAGPGLGGTEIWYKATAATGATGNKTLGDGGGSSGRWATLHLAFKEATAGGIVIPVMMNQYRQRWG